MLSKPFASVAFAGALLFGLGGPPARCSDGVPPSTQRIVPDPHRKTNVPSLAEPIEFPTLPPEEFRRVYGGSVAAAETDAASRFVVQWVKYSRVAPGGDHPDQAAASHLVCGETVVGQAMAILLNREMPNATREEHFRDLTSKGVPRLDEGYFRSKHFHFYFNTDPRRHPGNAVSVRQVFDLATEMEKAWDAFETSFRAPKARPDSETGEPMLDVCIYEFADDGLTNSLWNHISLATRVVRDKCKIKTIPAHELFHRVQYAYGFESYMGGLSWVTEATAAWAQKFRGGDVGDWMRHMNEFHTAGARRLFDRSYDALPFWVYLGHRVGNECVAIKTVWERFEAYLRTLKGLRPDEDGARSAFVAAIEEVVRARTLRERFEAYLRTLKGLHPDLRGARSAFAAAIEEAGRERPCSFDRFAADWLYANLWKDLEIGPPERDDASARMTYPYPDCRGDVLCCGDRHRDPFDPVKFDPFAQDLVHGGPPITLIGGETLTYNGNYHLFSVDERIRGVDIQVDSKFPLSYAVLVKQGKRVVRRNEIADSQKHPRLTVRFPPRGGTEVVVAIFGGAATSSYDIVASEAKD